MISGGEKGRNRDRKYSGKMKRQAGGEPETS
jgi:hypothetical protein